MPVAAPEAPAAPPAAEPAPARRPALVAPRVLRPSPATLVAAGLAAAVAYAAFARGATELPAEARLQVALAALALAATAALLVGRGLRAAAPVAAWAGLGLLALFAVWTGVSLDWSTAPDLTWAQLNRWVAYALATLVAFVVGSSLPRALERTALAYLAIATAVALYALAGKAIPEVSIAGLFDFDHTAYFSRLREPLAYWNALSLFCVLGVPPAVRAAADADRGVRTRAAAGAAGAVLLTTIALSYSRGGFVVLGVALAILFAVGPGRARLAAAAGAAFAGALPAVIAGFASDDLTGDGVPAAQRADDGLVFLAALVAGIAIAIGLVWLIARAGDRLSLGPRARRRARRGLIGAGILAAVMVLAVIGLSRGAVVTAGWESFTDVKYDKQNDPARILQTNSGNRWVWWNEAAGAWWDAPVAGHGAGSFPLLHRRYRSDELEVRQPHSVPLQLLAETGLVGAGLALGGIGLLAFAALGRIRGGRRALNDGVPAGREQRFGLALAAAAAASLVHLWFDWDTDIPGVALPLFVFLGVLAARPPGMPGVELPPGGAGLRGYAASLPQRGIALTLAALLAAGIAVSAVLPSLAADRLEAGQRAASRADYAEAGRQAEIAKRLNPLAVEPIFVAATAAQKRGEFTRASYLLGEAVRRQPDNPETWFRLAPLELLRGDLAKMEAAAYRILELDPQADVARFFFLANDIGQRSATATGTPLPSE